MLLNDQITVKSQEIIYFHFSIYVYTCYCFSRECFTVNFLAEHIKLVNIKRIHWVRTRSDFNTDVRKNVKHLCETKVVKLNFTLHFCF